MSRPKQLANPKMRDKKERYKALNKFKNVSHRCFGIVASIGFGKGSKIVCSICKKEVRKGTYIAGIWKCKECK